MKIPDLNKLIAAIECQDCFRHKCMRCPYDYQYLDDSGDHAYWWCNDDKIADDAIKLLYVLKEKI